MSTLLFRPHVLYLCAEPSLVRAQLDGARLTLERARPLRDDISTDEITPLPVMVHFDATLGRFPYLAIYGRRRTADREGQRPQRGLRGGRRRQALRQRLIT